jgi:hypothetical protein
MFLVAFPAVHRSVAGWLERYFSFLTAVCAGCLVHLSWSSETATSSAEATSSIVAHLYFSLLLVCPIKGCNRKFSHDPLNFYLDLVSDLRTGHKNYKALNTRDSIPLFGNALDCDIVDAACRDWSVFIFFCKQSFPSVQFINQPKRSTHRRD